MQSFKYLSRARAVLAGPTGSRAGPWVAGLLAMVAVSSAAVLAGLALVPGVSVGSGARTAAPVRPVPGAQRVPAVAGSPAGASAPGAAGGAGPGAGGEVGGGAGGVGGGAGQEGGAGPDELASRLGEILRLRERAYARRDATVLDTIYTADCACLRSGRAAIARLLADHAVWRGRSVTVRVERLWRVNDSLWIALAVLRRGAFRIEGEDGMLRSAEPAAGQRYRFALVRTGTGAWLLGHASLVEELPP